MYSNPDFIHMPNSYRFSQIWSYVGHIRYDFMCLGKGFLLQDHRVNVYIYIYIYIDFRH